MFIHFLKHQIDDKLFLVPILALLLITACEKEKVTTETSATSQTSKADDRTNGNNQVTICHLGEDGEYHTIQVNANSVPAHLAHGDYEGPCCTGNICFDAEDISYQGQMYYYDSNVWDCYNFGGAVAIYTAQFSLAAGTGYGGALQSFLYTTPSGGECVGIVGENITEEEYQCVLRLMRESIAANPDPINICIYSAKGSPNNEMVRKDALLDKMKEIRKQRSH